MGGEGAAREGEDAPAPPWAGAGVLGREGFSGASAFRPSLVSPSCGSLPVPVLLCCIQVPAELICLDPRALAEVDVISLEQAKKERAERLVQSRVPRAWVPLTRASRPRHVLSSTAPCLGGCCSFHSPPLPQGYDPDTRAPFQPKPKQKGRSSTASLVKRKRKVMDQEHRVSGHRGRAGRPTGSALLLASPAYCFSPVSPHPGQGPPEPGAAAAEAREGQAHRGPAVSPGQICALSQAPGPRRNILSPRPPVGNDPSLE